MSNDSIPAAALVQRLELIQLLKDFSQIHSSHGYLLMRLAVAKDAQDAFDVCKQAFADAEPALKRLEAVPAWLHTWPAEKVSEWAAAALRGGGSSPTGETLPAEIVRELDKAATKFPSWPIRGTDAAAIVAEECGELQQAVLQATYEGGTVEAVRKEAIQTAAMAIQFLLNLPDTTFERGEQAPKRRLAALSAPSSQATPPQEDRCRCGHTFRDHLPGAHGFYECVICECKRAEFVPAKAR